MRIPGICVLFLLSVLISHRIAAQGIVSIQNLPRAVLIDTHGYASGQLSRVGRENKFNRAFNKPYTGQILLGRDSASFISYGGFPLNLDANPWPFCFDKDDFEDLETFIGKDVVVEFKTPRSSALLSCSVVSELVAIYPVEKEYILDNRYQEGDISSFGTEISYGVEYGRITNAVQNKNLRRNYYLTIQVGGGGNKFSHFIINDRDLYDFAVENLKMAAMVKVRYSERLASRDILGVRTRLFVTAIEVVD